jgi:hypothetical protein
MILKNKRIKTSSLSYIHKGLAAILPPRPAGTHPTPDASVVWGGI